MQLMMQFFGLIFTFFLSFIFVFPNQSNYRNEVSCIKYIIGIQKTEKNQFLIL